MWFLCSAVHWLGGYLSGQNRDGKENNKPKKNLQTSTEAQSNKWSMKLPLFVPPSEKTPGFSSNNLSPPLSVSWENGKGGLSFSSGISSCLHKGCQTQRVGNEVITCYLLDLTVRHTSWKSVFESLSRVGADFWGSTAKKWRPATRLHTKNYFTAAARLLRVHLRSHNVTPELSRAFPRPLTKDSGLKMRYILLSLISARPPLTRATRSASTRPKNGDERAGPAFYLHVTDAWRGVGGGKGLGGWRGRGPHQRRHLPPLTPVQTARCQSCFHDTAGEHLTWQTIAAMPSHNTSQAHSEEHPHPELCCYPIVTLFWSNQWVHATWHDIRTIIMMEPIWTLELSFLNPHISYPS